MSDRDHTTTPGEVVNDRETPTDPALRREWDVHDRSCPSLEFFWRGEAACPTVPGMLLFPCAACHTQFWEPGVARFNVGRLCACCADHKGLETRMVRTRNGPRLERVL